MKKKLLLHICCAPDQTVAVERTVDEFEVTGFFSNSCIEPRGEYYHRMDDAKYLANLQNIELLKDDYIPHAFLNISRGLQNEPEKGKRCLKCIEYRMRRTAETAKMQNFDIFATTLTVSPHKNADYINEIGEKLAWEFEIEYFHTNFKKKDGFKRSLELSEKLGLYRQNYCGCRYSLQQKKARESAGSEETVTEPTESDSHEQSPPVKKKTEIILPPGAFYKPKDLVSRRFKKGKK